MYWVGSTTLVHPGKINNSSRLGATGINAVIHSFLLSIHSSVFLYFLFLLLESSLCSEGADVAFFIDASENVTSFAYRREKEYVKELMRRLVETRNNINAAVVIYSNKAFVKLNFSQEFSLENFNFFIDKLPYLGGKPMRAPAFSTATVFRPVFTGPRTHLPKVAIELTYTASAAGPPLLSRGFNDFMGRFISVVQSGANFLLSPTYETNAVLNAIGKYYIRILKETYLLTN